MEDIYDKFEQFLTPQEKKLFEGYADLNLISEEDVRNKEDAEKYGQSTAKSFVENPEKKVQQYLKYIDCTCEIPSYIISLGELLGALLEERATLV